LVFDVFELPVKSSVSFAAGVFGDVDQFAAFAQLPFAEPFHVSTAACPVWQSKPAAPATAIVIHTARPDAKHPLIAVFIGDTSF
jgi:hypothetical protein